MAENLFLRVERMRCVQYCQVSLALLDRIDDETFPLFGRGIMFVFFEKR